MPFLLENFKALTIGLLACLLRCIWVVEDVPIDPCVSIFCLYLGNVIIIILSAGLMTMAGAMFTVTLMRWRCHQLV